MKTIALICNIALFAFTCFVILTDGMPQEAIYIVFTLLVFLTPVLSMATLALSMNIRYLLRLPEKRNAPEEPEKAGEKTSFSTFLRIGTILCNIAMFGFSCWAIISQYPHPEEKGVWTYTVLLLLTPILTLVAILRKTRNKS